MDDEGWVDQTYTWVWVTDRPWSDADTERYDSGRDGFTGIRLMCSRSAYRAAKVDLHFLAQIRRPVRSLHIDVPMYDDTAVFARPEIEELELLTICKKPLRLDRLPNLWGLTVRARPGVEEGIPGAVGLTHLSLVNFKYPDLRCVRNLPRLRALRIDARRGRFALDGIEDCVSLRSVMALGATIENLGPLAGLAKLTDIHLTGVPGEASSEPLDLRPLTALPRLYEIRLAMQRPIRSLAPLLDMPALQSVAVGEDVLDRDMTPLVKLTEQGVRVGSFVDHPGYTHTSDEIQQLQAALGVI
ncbi:hypothetical protein ACQP00_29660 [Dactylosporangium sp. CS-047395]|uniref:hypothetical protein n=1 Tax=Dactylosporangium sp. CS-047395 TaxID=3239936 RepID=UPI003D92F840